MAAQPDFIRDQTPNPELETNPFKVLAEEIIPWARYNFPGDERYPERKVLGIMEEISELNMAQEAQNREGQIDAVGDILVFTAHLCGDVGLDFVEIVQEGFERLWNDGSFDRRLNTKAKFNLSWRTVHDLTHSSLKMAQGIRGDRESHLKKLKAGLTDVVSYLQNFCLNALSGLHLGNAVIAAWSKVRLRDWASTRVPSSEESFTQDNIVEFMEFEDELDHALMSNDVLYVVVAEVDGSQYVEVFEDFAEASAVQAKAAKTAGCTARLHTQRLLRMRGEGLSRTDLLFWKGETDLDEDDIMFGRVNTFFDLVSKVQPKPGDVVVVHLHPSRPYSDEDKAEIADLVLSAIKANHALLDHAEFSVLVTDCGWSVKAAPISEVSKMLSAVTAQPRSEVDEDPGQ